MKNKRSLRPPAFWNDANAHSIYLLASAPEFFGAIGLLR